MPMIAVFVLAALLAGCSGSDRVEHIVPSWANTPARAAPHYAAARKNRAEDHGTPVAAPVAAPVAEPQPAKPPAVQHHSEE